MDSTLQIRIDKKTKDKAKKVFGELGVDMSSGIKLFISQVINTGAIPFSPTTKNGFTLKQEYKILEETSDAIKNGKKYKTVKEAHIDALEA